MPVRRCQRLASTRTPRVGAQGLDVVSGERVTSTRAPRAASRPGGGGGQGPISCHLPRVGEEVGGVWGRPAGVVRGSPL